MCWCACVFCLLKTCFHGTYFTSLILCWCWSGTLFRRVYWSKGWCRIRTCLSDRCHVSRSWMKIYWPAKETHSLQPFLKYQWTVINKTSVKTKIRIFKSTVLAALLYGAESWKVTEGVCQKLEIFHNKCLRRILKIYWPNVISAQDLLTKINMEPLTMTIRDRRWKWLGPVCRVQQSTAFPKTAIKWTPQNCHKMNSPKLP